MNSKDEFRAAQSTEDMPPTTTHPPTIPPAIPSQPEMEHEAPVQASHSSADPGHDEAPGSCAKFGCSTFKPGRSCQCNAACKEHGNCCHDFATHCSRSESQGPVGSCKSFGCGSFSPKHSCQCNKACTVFGSCCHDYAKQCAHGATCANYGCGTFKPLHACQCDAECHQHNNCCSDFKESCNAAHPGHPGPDANANFGRSFSGEGNSCARIGCGSYKSGEPCQCNAGCRKHGNCCPDYEATCSLPPGPMSTCAVLGCVEFREGNDCQCDEECSKHNSCCPDYSFVCKPKAVSTRVK